jgi:hypothetical protein
MSENDKKIVFSEDIDHKISGFSLGFAFITTGLILLVFPDFFISESITDIIRKTYIFVGIIGLIVELNKNKSNDIKGIGDLVLGLSIILIAIIIYIYIDMIVFNILSFLLLQIALFGFFRGLVSIIYSLILKTKNNSTTKKNIISEILLMFTRFASLTLIIFQIIEVVRNYTN